MSVGKQQIIGVAMNPKTMLTSNIEDIRGVEEEIDRSQYRSLRNATGYPAGFRRLTIVSNLLHPVVKIGAGPCKNCTDESERALEMQKKDRVIDAVKSRTQIE